MTPEQRAAVRLECEVIPVFDANGNWIGTARDYVGADQLIYVQRDSSSVTENVMEIAEVPGLGRFAAPDATVVYRWLLALTGLCDGLDRDIPIVCKLERVHDELDAEGVSADVDEWIGEL